MNTHHFDSTVDAYDACQCDDSIHDGDLLVIASERVVGLAYTWPIAVTPAHGELNVKKPEAIWMTVCKASDISYDSVLAAQCLAVELGFMGSLE